MYVPILVFSLRSLYYQGVPESNVVTLLPDTRGTRAIHLRFSQLGQKARRQRKTVLMHALMAYMCNMIHLPVMIWQVS